MSDELSDWAKLAKAHQKLDRLREDEERAYSEWYRCNRARHLQEDEVSFRFNKLMEATEERCGKKIR